MKQIVNYEEFNKYLDETLSDMFFDNEIADNFFPLEDINDIVLWKKDKQLAVMLEHKHPTTYYAMYHDWCLSVSKK